jgi:hypothetical protein
MNKKRKTDHSLVKRYLFWLYKTTRDEWDRTERKFTQLEVDRDLQRIFKEYEDGPLAPFFEEWGRYMANKEADAKKLKFDAQWNILGAYAFLRLKLEAIEGVIAKRLGARQLASFEKMLEDAAMKNILQDTSGKR